METLSNTEAELKKALLIKKHGFLGFLISLIPALNTRKNINLAHLKSPFHILKSQPGKLYGIALLTKQFKSNQETKNEILYPICII